MTAKHPIAQWLEDSIAEDKREQYALVAFLEEHEADRGIDDILYCSCGEWEQKDTDPCDTWAEHFYAVLTQRYNVYRRFQGPSNEA